MIDPFAIFLGLFGGALLGWVAGLARGRGFVDTIIYIAVAEGFEVCLVVLVNDFGLVDMLLYDFHRTVNPSTFHNVISEFIDLIVIYGMPLFGGLIGVFVVGMVRRFILGVQSHEPNAARNFDIKLRYVLLGIAVVSASALISTISTSGKESWNDSIDKIFLPWGFAVLYFALPVLTGYHDRRTQPVAFLANKARLF